ncbi:MAG: cytochrome c biogenesis protein CcsA [Desulfurobacteriaceae bacterium]
MAEERFFALLVILLNTFSLAVKEVRTLHLLSSLVLGVLIAYRSFKAGYPPLFTSFDSISLFAFLFFLAAYFLRAGRFVSAVGVLLTLPLLFVNPHVKEIPPVIRTPLFFLHVGTAFLSYSLFVLSSLFALYSLIGKELSFLKVLLVGHYLFTLSLFFGGVWAYLAWGDIFPLEPKTFFSLFLWFYASLTLHLQFDSSLRKLIPYFTVALAPLVLFVYLGVNYLFGGTHGF